MGNHMHTFDYIYFVFAHKGFLKGGRHCLWKNFRLDVPTVKNEFGLACWRLLITVALRSVRTSFQIKEIKFCNCIIHTSFTCVKIYARQVE